MVIIHISLLDFPNRAFSDAISSARFVLRDRYDRDARRLFVTMNRADWGLFGGTCHEQGCVDSSDEGPLGWKEIVEGKTRLRTGFSERDRSGVTKGVDDFFVMQRLEIFDGIDGSMDEKSRRRLMLEQSLAEDPTDSFLRYGLAIQCLREGDTEEGRERLMALIAEHPDDQVAAYQQLGQSYVDTGAMTEAVGVLRTGIAKAQGAGDWHAAAEMEQLLASLP